MARVCVFCGSKSGVEPRLRLAAEETGRALVAAGHAVVYGGGSVGLMGAVADAALAAGGEVIGVIPHALDVKEIAHPAVKEMHVVGSMHERKAKMLELSDGFLALPGGFGTLEELMEVLSWAQLGIHRKPTGLLNVEGFYDGLIAFVEHAIETGFIKPKYRDLFIASGDPLALVELLFRHEMPPVRQWAKPSET